MNIAVDFGNTAAKVGIFENEILRKKLHFTDSGELRSFLESHPVEEFIVSSVSFPAEEVVAWVVASGKKSALTFQLPLPLKILYATPQTLGVDRIAAACGAIEIFPKENCLVIDAGTCVNYEFVDDHGNYHGGAISPGINMRFEAMHTFTSRLPLIHPVQNIPLTGNSTESCMQSGVINGIRAEMEGVIRRYIDLFPKIKVILCGGDVSFFENQLKHPTFVAHDLVLQGLSKIMRHNASR